MTSFKNKNIAGFIQEQLKLIKPFQVIELPLNDNNIENLDIAVKETEIACKKLIKKNGALRDIIKKIKSNKLNKKQSNLMLNKISTNIKSIIDLPKVPEISPLAKAFKTEFLSDLLIIGLKTGIIFSL